jgi:uroporphyrinogen-III synthase
MSHLVLLTAAKEDTEQFRVNLQPEYSLLDCPLERYQPVKDDSEIVTAFNQLDTFENIVHGSKRNAIFFMDKVKELDKLEAVRNKLNFALNQPTADYLEQEGVAAVHPHAEGKAIDLLEFMLRIRRIGKTLYPCGDKTKEDLPGFLRELDIPVQELVFFTLEGPHQEDLKEYQKQVMENNIGTVIFHSRRSVNRILAAFPNLNFEDTQVISGDKAVTEKLENEGVSVHSEASGSWNSILEQL